jgi:hypothetical protein
MPSVMATEMKAAAASTALMTASTGLGFAWRLMGAADGPFPREGPVAVE